MDNTKSTLALVSTALTKSLSLVWKPFCSFSILLSFAPFLQVRQTDPLTSNIPEYISLAWVVRFQDKLNRCKVHLTCFVSRILLFRLQVRSIQPAHHWRAPFIAALSTYWLPVGYYFNLIAITAKKFLHSTRNNDVVLYCSTVLDSFRMKQTSFVFQNSRIVHFFLLSSLDPISWRCIETLKAYQAWSRCRTNLCIVYYFFYIYPR